MKIEQLLYEVEGATLDFKSKQYPFRNARNEEKKELLKDIIAFANAWRRAAAFILVGVEECPAGPAKVTGIAESIDDADIQQFINSKTNKPIDFLYYEMELDGRTVGVFDIPVQKGRPYYLKKAYAGLAADTVYIRRGSSTVVANPTELAEMGKAEGAEEETKLEFGFFDLLSESEIGTEIVLRSKQIAIPDLEKIPDFSCPSRRGRGNFGIPFPQSANADYYRDLANWIWCTARYKQIACYIKNIGSRTLYNICASASVSATDAAFSESVLEKPQEYRGSFDHLPPPPVAAHASHRSWRGVFEDFEKDRYRLEMSVQDIYPGETIMFNGFYVSALEENEIRLEFTFYGENLSDSMERVLVMQFNIEKTEIEVSDLVALGDKTMEDL